MDLSKYQTISGITVAASEQAFVSAQIVRSRKILEGMLGFTLNSKKVNNNVYDEQGKAPTDCACPDVDPDSLLPADEVENAYRLYDYNRKDEYFHIDPFTDVYNVKLVYNDITLKTFEATDYRKQIKQGWGKFIQDCQLEFCWCDCNCVQLAVDAQWLNLCELDEILYIWADMVTYYADCKKDVKQESIGSHSYTKFDNLKPEFEAENLAILKKYAGPNGTLTKTITI